jgi:hypothetical protein
MCCVTCYEVRGRRYCSKLKSLSALIKIGDVSHVYQTSVQIADSTWHHHFVGNLSATHLFRWPRELSTMWSHQRPVCLQTLRLDSLPGLLAEHGQVQLPQLRTGQSVNSALFRQSENSPVALAKKSFGCVTEMAVTQ